MPYSYSVEIIDGGSLVLGHEVVFYLIEKKRIKAPLFVIFGVPFFMIKNSHEENVICTVHVLSNGHPWVRISKKPADHIKFVEFVADLEDDVRYAIIDKYI